MVEGKTKKDLVEKYVFIFSMIGIDIIWFVIFYLYPNIQSFTMPFTRNGKFSLDYIKLVWENIKVGTESDIIRSLKNTIVYYFVSLFTGLPLSLFFAYGLYRRIKGSKFFNFVFLIPMMVSSVVLSQVAINLLSPDGPVNAVLTKYLGVKEAKMFFFDEKQYLGVSGATWSMVLYVVWTSFGLNLIMYSGALTRIPIDLWEQAKLDGVGYMRGLFQIALPLIWPTFSTMIVLSCINILGADGPVLLFTKGMYDTSTLGYWMYDNVILNKQYEYASALGLYMTLVSLPVFFLAMKIKQFLPQDIEY